MAENKNPKIFDYFKKAIESQRLSHAYLFWGGDSNEMKETAASLAKELGTDFYDILEISPLEGKKDISIDQIRGVKRHLSLSPYNSFYKVAIINRAQTMNLESANAILKTLEEPQGNSLLILIAQNPDLLPQTIKSRVVLVRFVPRPLDKTEINSKYVELLQWPVEKIFKSMEEISKNEEDIFSLLDSWLLWFRNLLIGKNELKYLNAVKEIQITKDLLSKSNMNKRLALENLVLNIK